MKMLNFSFKKTYHKTNRTCYENNSCLYFYVGNHISTEYVQKWCSTYLKLFIISYDAAKKNKPTRSSVSYDDVVHILWHQESVKPIIIHSPVWLARYNMKPSGSDSQWRRSRFSPCLQTPRQPFVPQLSDFHICIQIQILQMAIEPFLNQYVICWLGEASYTS